MSLSHDEVMVDVARTTGSLTTASRCPTIFKPITEWWESRSKTEIRESAQFEEQINREIPRQQIQEPLVLIDIQNMDKDSDSHNRNNYMKFSPIARESRSTRETSLPSAVMMREFAQQAVCRTRERQRNHDDYVAELRENRNKARPLKTGKSYDRVQRLWTVCVCFKRKLI